MEHPSLESYIAGLPVGQIDFARAAEVEDTADTTVDLSDLPDGIVTGSNLLQFADGTNATVRSAVTLSLLAAQRVAANDTVIMNPDDWINRHNMVLKNLNWTIDGGGAVNSKFEDLDVAVHEAIIPFLTTAFGPAATAATIITTALKQLKEMDKDKPWIRLFERESRRFDVSEYQFSYVDTEGGDTILRMAAARLDAKFGFTQVLFVKVKQERAKFKAANTTMRARSDLLESMNGPLQAKLAMQTDAFIRALDVGPAPA